MCIVRDEEIVGYLIGEECVCRRCVNGIEVDRVTLNNLIIEDVLGNGERYFCDRCHEEIA